MNGLEPTALHFKSVDIRGFRALRNFKQEFASHNVLVGMNGGGKTTLLHLLSGIAGSDQADMLVAGEKIDHVEVVLGAGNEEFRQIC